MSEEQVVLSELRDAIESMRAIKKRMAECERDMRGLLAFAQASVARLATGRLGDFREQHLDVLALVGQHGWLPAEEIGRRLGRSRKSIRISIEKLEKAELVLKEGRKFTLTDAGTALISVTNTGVLAGAKL